MRVHWLQHAEHEDLGCIGAMLEAAGHTLSCTRLQWLEVLPPPNRFDALLIMGGPMNVNEHDRYPWLPNEKRWIAHVISRGIRVLGICLGAQLLADVLGGEVMANAEREIGWFPVALNAAGRAHPWLAGLPAEFESFHWHGDTYRLPPKAQCLAASEACAQQAFAYGRLVLGLQFHLEVLAETTASWYAADPPAAGRFVQTPEMVLGDPARFERVNARMRSILERFAPPAV